MFDIPFSKVFLEGYTASWLETVFLCVVILILVIGASILFMLWRRATKQLKNFNELTKGKPTGCEDKQSRNLSD